MKLEDINPDLTFLDLGADDFDQMEIIWTIERQYDFKIFFPDRFHSKSIRFSDIYDYIQFNYYP